jgi:hypothetical protein
MPSGWVVGYATSTMWQEVERPAQTLAGASLAHTPFEQRVRRLSGAKSSHCDKTILQRLPLAGRRGAPRPSATRLTRRLATAVARSNAALRRYRPASTAHRMRAGVQPHPTSPKAGQGALRTPAPVTDRRCRGFRLMSSSQRVRYRALIADPSRSTSSDQALFGGAGGARTRDQRIRDLPFAATANKSRISLSTNHLSCSFGTLRCG